MKIYLDMDGVLADFVGGAVNAHGYLFMKNQLINTRTGEEVNWEAGNYNINEVLGMSIKDFWTPLNEDGFWLRLGHYPWAEKLIAYAQNLVGIDNVWIASSPSLSARCAKEKIMWMRQHFPCIPIQNIIITRNKWIYSEEDSVLVDDSDEVLGKWQEQDGRGILFPQWWNSAYKYIDKRWEIVTEKLNPEEKTWY